MPGNPLVEHEAFRRWGDWARLSLNFPGPAADLVGRLGVVVNVGFEKTRSSLSGLLDLVEIGVIGGVPNVEPMNDNNSDPKFKTHSTTETQAPTSRRSHLSQIAAGLRIGGMK